VPVVRITSPREITYDLYQQVTAKVDLGNNPPDGLIIHTASEVDGHLKIVDIWESDEHADRFGQERLGPAIAEIAGEQMAGPPDPSQLEVYEVKALVKP